MRVVAREGKFHALRIMEGKTVVMHLVPSKGDALIKRDGAWITIILYEIARMMEPACSKKLGIGLRVTVFIIAIIVVQNIN